MKESYLIQTAQYARDRAPLRRTGFCLVGKACPEKAHSTLSKVKSKYWETTHIYGIRIPKSVQEPIAIDKENGDTKWTDYIRKEMMVIRGAMEEHDGNVIGLVGFQQLITVHIVFDVKLGENF